MKTHTTLQLTVAALVLALVSNLHAQTAAAGAPEAKAEAKAAKPAPAPTVDPSAADLGTMNVSICYEAFSLPIAKAAELQRKGMTDEELYKEVVNTGKLERMLVLRTKSGQRAVVENVTAYKHVTEYTSPQIPGNLVKEKVEPIPLPLAPTSFEREKVGDTMEIEPTLSPDAKTVDFQFDVSHLVFTKREKWGQGLAEVEVPQFESQKLNSNITASVGSPRFIGTLNPPFGNGLDARNEQSVWFCFITATVAQNNSAPQKKAAR